MDPYDADYFLRGKQTGKSLYENYRWLPDLTIPMVQAIVKHCGIEKNASVLDFGCARGYTVKAFRVLEYAAWGCDISEWALANADPLVKDYLYKTVPSIRHTWVIAKDVLEHVQLAADAIDQLMFNAIEGVFAVVPLSETDFDSYVVPEYELDVTHVHRLTLASWVQMFIRPGWDVTASYRVRGVKDNYAQYTKGNGFITARRVW